MNNVIRWLIILIFSGSLPLFAQDVQEIYEEAKSALVDGDYQTAKLKVSIAQVMIEKDPNLDPNSHFAKRLLPKIEDDANKVEMIVKALAELDANDAERVVLPDIPLSGQSVEAYTRLAKDAGKSILTRRDSIMALYDIDPKYRAAIINLPVYRNIESYASEGLIDQLSQKFYQITTALTDSLNNLNERFNTAVSNLEQLKKSAVAGRAEREKLEQELARISQERLDYLNSLSEMLIGEASVENPELQGNFIEKNVENIFTDVIQSEIKRIQSISEADSATYKDLMKNYERVKNYNRIFLKNNISPDQSVLLAQYEAAIKNIIVEQPLEFNYTWIIIIVLAVALMIAIIIAFGKSQKKTASPGSPSSGSAK